MYVCMNCGFRSVVKGLELFNDFLSGALGSLPCHQSIENWLLKVGIVEYLDTCSFFKDKRYAIIVDESITVGSQKLLLILAVPADHVGHALSYSDVKVLAVLVSSSWKAEDVEKEISKLCDKIGHAPEYMISDNGHNLRRGAELANVPRHRDISHTIGIIMKEEYDNRSDFKEFMDIMNKKRLSYQLTDNAYLLPPKLRAVARFMNMSKWVAWGKSILDSFDNLDKKRQDAYSFVLKYRNLIEELHQLLSNVDFICSRFKCDGLSEFSAGFCSDYVSKSLIDCDNATEGGARVGRKILNYIKDELSLIRNKQECHSISSDIIESTFGMYKNMQPNNRLTGITYIVLAIPLYGRVNSIEDRKNLNVKDKLESVRMVDLKDWKQMTLFDNWQVKRMLDLKKVI